MRQARQSVVAAAATKATTEPAETAAVAVAVVAAVDNIVVGQSEPVTLAIWQSLQPRHWRGRTRW